MVFTTDEERASALEEIVVNLLDLDPREALEPRAGEDAHAAARDGHGLGVSVSSSRCVGGQRSAGDLGVEQGI